MAKKKCFPLLFPFVSSKACFFISSRKKFYRFFPNTSTQIQSISQKLHMISFKIENRKEITHTRPYIFHGNSTVWIWLRFYNNIKKRNENKMLWRIYWWNDRFPIAFRHFFLYEHSSNLNYISTFILISFTKEDMQTHVKIRTNCSLLCTLWIFCYVLEQWISECFEIFQFSNISIFIEKNQHEPHFLFMVNPRNSGNFAIIRGGKNLESLRLLVKIRKKVKKHLDIFN